ncbi:hypothetical protein MMC12_008046 [Toensbergia leucococca]|nr:hypothetical protein [Toensbergia leucococca]
MSPLGAVLVLLSLFSAILPATADTLLKKFCYCRSKSTNGIIRTATYHSERLNTSTTWTDTCLDDHIDPSVGHVRTCRQELFNNPRKTCHKFPDPPAHEVCLNEHAHPLSYSLDGKHGRIHRWLHKEVKVQLDCTEECRSMFGPELGLKYLHSECNSTFEGRVGPSAEPWSCKTVYHDRLKNL